MQMCQKILDEVVSSYWSDDESEEARSAFDDFWKSEDVIMKDHDTPFYDDT